MPIPQPEFVYTLGDEWDDLQSFWPGGRIDRALRHPEQIRAFDLVWTKAKSSEVDDIRTEFDTAKGRAGTFSFTPPDEGSAVTVRFDQDEFDPVWIGADQFFVRLRLVQEVF